MTHDNRTNQLKMKKTNFQESEEIECAHNETKNHNMRRSKTHRMLWWGNINYVLNFYKNMMFSRGTSFTL